jgi:hypothetical protein
MNGGDEKVVCLTHETVGDVDNDATRDGRGFDPIPRFGEDFETGVGVLCYEGEAFEVGVGADA